MSEQSELPEAGRRVYARPKADEDPQAFTQRFLGMIKDAAREAERDDEVGSD